MVTIHWYEGEQFTDVKDGHIFTGLKAANNFLHRVMSSKDDGGYNKVKFTIDLGNGFEYQGRFDVVEYGKTQDCGGSIPCFKGYLKNAAKNHSPFVDVVKESSQWLEKIAAM